MFATSNFARNCVAAAGAALIATGCFAVAATPAAAADVHSKTVSYADLNLQNAQGRAVLDARIKAAAEAVCTSGGSDLQSRTSETRCVRDAIRKANAS